MKIKVKHLISLAVITVIFSCVINRIIQWVLQESLVPIVWYRFNLVGLYGLALIIPFILILWLIERKDWVGFGWNKFSWSGLKYPLLGLVLAFPIFLISRLLVPDYDRWFIEMQGVRTWSGLLFFILTTLFFVFKEELFGRFFQARLSRYYGSIFAILATAAQFAIFHYHPLYRQFTWPIVITTFFATIVLAAVYERTKSIWYALIYHFLINSISAVLIFLHGQLYGSFEYAAWIVYGLFFIIFIASAVRAYRPLVRKIPHLPVLDWVLAGIICIGLPIFLMNV